MYIVDVTVRGRFTVDKVEVSTPKIPDSRDHLSVDHPLARPVWSCSTGNTCLVCRNTTRATYEVFKAFISEFVTGGAWIHRGSGRMDIATCSAGSGVLHKTTKQVVLLQHKP